MKPTLLYSVASNLLTPKQIECMTLIERDDSTAEIAKVGVYERHDEKCGGDPELTHRLFDLEIDTKTGAALWDNNRNRKKPHEHAHLHTGCFGGRSSQWV